jgi:rhamnosyltransferase subunit B
MRVIMTALGSRGDVYPYLGFAKALEDRGHTVTMISSGNNTPFIESAGFDYVELYDSDTFFRSKELSETALKRRPFTDPRKRSDPDQMKGWETTFELAPERLYRVIEKLYVPGETLVAMSELFTFGAGGLLHEKLGVPYARIWHMDNLLEFWQPVVGRRLKGLETLVRDKLLAMFWMGREFKRRYNRFRTELELPPEPNFIRALVYCQQINIVLLPRWFLPWYRDRLPNTILTDFPLYKPDNAPQLTSELERFLAQGSPPVLFGGASWQGLADDYYKPSVDACRALGVRGILLSRDTQHLTADQDSVIHADPDIFYALLPRAAAMVHHGGLGTCVEVLANGVPQMTVPEMHDQPYHAKTMKRLGVSLSVPRRQYARRAIPLLKQLLESQEIRENSRRLAARFQGGPEFSIAISSLESLLESSRLSARSR